MAGSDSRDDPATVSASTTKVSGAAIARIQDQLSALGKSAPAKYRDLVVGRPGIGALLKYEFVVTLAQARAGALGLVLRKTLYPWLLGSCGRNVVFGQNVVLRHPHKIHIGRARREIGYAPAVGLREGIERTLEWYRAQNWL